MFVLIWVLILARFSTSISHFFSTWMGFDGLMLSINNLYLVSFLWWWHTWLLFLSVFYGGQKAYVDLSCLHLFLLWLVYLSYRWTSFYLHHELISIYFSLVIYFGLFDGVLECLHCYANLLILHSLEGGNQFPWVGEIMH